MARGIARAAFDPSGTEEPSMRRNQRLMDGLAAVCALVLVAGCAQTRTSGSAAAAERAMELAGLEGGWVLREVDGRPVAGSKAELVIGRFTLEAGRLAAKAASTRMACLSEPAAAVSRTLGALLADGAQATEVTLDGRRGLRLRGAAGQVVFERSAQP
jgi:heat shock protein HslJ